MSLSQSSRIHQDPLSEVLTVLGARSGGRTRLEAAGAWALTFPQRERLKLVAVRRGTCWMIVHGAAPRRLGEGDVFLIGRTAHTVASDPAVAPIDGAALYAEPGRETVRLGGDETVMLGGSIAFARADARFLLDALPPFLLLDRRSAAALSVSRTLDLLDAEIGHGRIGGALVTTRLSEILFVEAIRAYVAEQGEACVGWIGALADPPIGAALGLIHAEVAHPWTVAALAARVGMSRSAFSARFAGRVGRPPLDYLTHWRMLLARHLLAEGNGDLAAIARAVGYLSPSAFGHAFKRAFGQSPRQRKGGRLPEHEPPGSLMIMSGPGGPRSDWLTASKALRSAPGRRRRTSRCRS